jgi:DNA-binding NtrC family response regulator
MTSERRFVEGPDRRRIPRGGRRGTDRQGRHPRVLVADSDAGARRPCVRYLSLFGFDVEEAATGDEAVVALNSCRPHLLIADARLPSTTQFTTAVAKEFHIPVIVTTTDHAGSVPPEAIGVLIKPFPLATMLNEVRRALNLAERAAHGVLGG